MHASSIHRRLRTQQRIGCAEPAAKHTRVRAAASCRLSDFYIFSFITFTFRTGPRTGRRTRRASSRTGPAAGACPWP